MGLLDPYDFGICIQKTVKQELFHNKIYYLPNSDRFSRRLLFQQSLCQVLNNHTKDGNEILKESYSFLNSIFCLCLGCLV